jgi:flagellar biosynthesis protein FlhA
VPNLITVSGIQRVLQMLLAERVSIRDLATILEGIADGIAGSRNPVTLSEHVRARLSRQLCAQYTSPSGYLPLIALSAKWEQAFADSLVGQGDEPSLRCNLRACRSSLRWCVSVSRRRRAKARRRCL